jgi:hypothetical protein
MFSCDHLYHPFLNDPGTSQDQRLPAALSDDSPAIDDREIADFLNYFSALAHQINFYDANLNVSDWGPFFSGDLPFVLSNMAAKDINTLNAVLGTYTKLFTRRPSVQGLQLLFQYTWYSIIYPIQQWAAELQNSGLPLEQTLQTLIKDRLPGAVKEFIKWMNTAVKCFCIAAIDTSVLLQNSAWGLAEADLTTFDEQFSCTRKGTRSRLLALQSSLSGLTDSFMEVLNLAGTGAADQVNEQFYGLLQTTGQQVIRPHLALLYTFLNQYLFVLDDLNNLTDKHLSYFFQNVLSLQPGGVKPDEAYVIFSLQKQVPSYPLPAGLLLKDGKDNKSADIYFSLEKPIVVTQTQATAFRTLFVNTSLAAGKSYVEGVYMAPDATKSDGITQAFPDPTTASWPTLGAKLSEYTPPMAQGPVAYPSARLGFALTSKILLMNEGERKVHIRLACQWVAGCDSQAMSPEAAQLFMTAFSDRWLIITQELLDQAVIMGLRQSVADLIRDHWLVDPCRVPICKDDDQPVYLPYRLIRLHNPTAQGVTRESMAEIRKLWDEIWLGFIAEEAHRFDMRSFEADIWKSLLLPQSVFDVSFSGAKGWVVPKYTEMTMTPSEAGPMNFELDIYAVIGKDQDAVTFYDKKVLMEDLGATDPLVKIQLNDLIKIPLEDYLVPGGTAAPAETPAATCCLQSPSSTCGELVSFYTFFRNVIVLGPGTGIHITVCGVKNLVVQNDDNVLNVKKPFTPFGVKPIVPDYDIYVPLFTKLKGLRHKGRNLIGPNFYIGSAEVFLKKWTRINVNLNWKGKPRSFRNYYRAYFLYPMAPIDDFPKHEVNLAVLHNGSWAPDASVTYSRANDKTGDNTRPFFSHKEGRIASCHDRGAYHYSYDLFPADFSLSNKLTYDSVFAPLTNYSNSVLNGFLRIRMENQDFLHKIYPMVMAERMIERAQRHLVPLPNEPWTPTILDIAIDYEALAGPEDIQLIQLYPYTGCYKQVDISGEPTLFAAFCDEGNLFIGLSGLVPGDGLNVLFQLAEATGETEGGAGSVEWQYLAGNEWVELRTIFEVVEDDTHGLSTTGIIQFVFPNDISSNNTLLPSGTYWIKASMSSGAEAASETRAIITQAALAIFANDPPLNDQTRPGNIPLDANSLTKLANPDPKIASVTQPYSSFGGSSPETYNNVFNQRVSEQLRHKGRAIQKWDYERIVLQLYPKVLRAKCITHSHALSNPGYRWDFPMAPGEVIVAVLPDPAQLAVGNSLQPTVPASLLTQIEGFLSASTSPFVRVSVRNPRYEPIDMCLTISLQPEMNAPYFQTQLQTEIRNFMAPWQQENTDAFEFAQRLYTAVLVQFIESREYVDKVLGLEMCHTGEPMREPAPDFIDPLTPRSILVAGKIVVHIGVTAQDQSQSKVSKVHGRKQ